MDKLVKKLMSNPGLHILRVKFPLANEVFTLNIFTATILKKKKSMCFVYKYTNVVYTHHILLFNIHLNDQSIVK